MSLEIYWVRGSAFTWRVLLAAEAKGLDYESKMISLAKGENRTPEFLRMSPRGHVPLLRDGEFILTESMAIVAYLDSLSAINPLFGGNPREQARVWEAVSQVTSDFERAAMAFAEPILFDAKEGDRTPPPIASPDRLKTELGFLEDGLAGHSWLASAKLSAADIAAFPFVSLVLRATGKDEASATASGLLPFDQRYPRLAAWAARFEALPFYLGADFMDRAPPRRRQ